MRLKTGVFVCALALAACGTTLRPIRINSDPNQEALDRMHDAQEADNVEAFIAAHPDLDTLSKRQLRDGTLSRSEAGQRLKQKRP